MKVKALSIDEIQLKLKDHSEWSLKDKKLHRDFQFKDFKQAFAYMTKVADIAERMNHHPEWFNVYNRLSIELTTHDAGGISEKDFELATQLDQIYAKI